MLRIIRVRLPTEWACHWRKLYFYLLCRGSVGPALAPSLPLSICAAAAALGARGAGRFLTVLKALSARRDASPGFVSLLVSTSGRAPFVSRRSICIRLQIEDV